MGEKIGLNRRMGEKKARMGEKKAQMEEKCKWRRKSANGENKV